MEGGMLKIADLRKIGWDCLMLLVLLINLSFSIQTDLGTVNLKPVKQSFVPTEFYIHSVADFREVNSTLGNLIYLDERKNSAYKIEAKLAGGTVNSVKNFFEKSLATNKNLQPISIRVTTLKITEDKLGAGFISGTIELALAFYVQKDFGQSTHLLNFRSKGKYQRRGNQMNVIEQVLQQTFSNSLIYFNNYINRESPCNIKLAKSVELTFSNYIKQDADTVYYAKDRPLNWDDFKGKTSSRKYAAYIYPDFGYNEDITMKNGVVQVAFTLRVFLAKSASWANTSSRNAYVLNHEQRHFDIQKIFTEKFKDDLKKEKLTPDNFEGIINVQYLETRREIHRMQEKYDDETNHGLNVSQQVYWDKFIDEQLLKYKVN